MKPYRFEYQFKYNLSGKRYLNLPCFQPVLAHNLTDAMRALPRKATRLSYQRVEVTRV
jgi:hypothetical protein